MATYNGERYICDQLESILRQLDKDDEVIISDDASIDKTVDFIESFNDKRIKLLRNDTFRSPVKNFENALRHSTGDIIFLSDQDDIWQENKVKVMSQILNKYDLVVSDCKVINGNGTVVNDSFFEMRKSRKGLLKNIYKNSFLGCCMAFNRRILDKSLPFPSNIPMHDMWIGLIAELFGRTYFIEDKLIYYRRHSSNATSQKRSSIGQVINWRFNLSVSLIKKLLVRRTIKI